jgi:hypothetical protein
MPASLLEMFMDQSPDQRRDDRPLQSAGIGQVTSLDACVLPYSIRIRSVYILPVFANRTIAFGAQRQFLHQIFEPPRRKGAKVPSASWRLCVLAVFF